MHAKFTPNWWIPSRAISEHTHIYIHTRTHTYIRTHTHARARAHAYTHKQTFSILHTGCRLPGSQNCCVKFEVASFLQISFLFEHDSLLHSVPLDITIIAYVLTLE
jgi:hypothetical protein